MKFLLYTMGDDSQPTPPLTPEQMAEIGKFSVSRGRVMVGSSVGGGDRRR